jgi:acid stress-induced BolA-like protein IbaG/YrbA
VRFHFKEFLEGRISMKKAQVSGENSNFEAGKIIISQLKIVLSMTRHFLPQRRLLSHLLSMAISEAKMESKRKKKGSNAKKPPRREPRRAIVGTAGADIGAAVGR